MSFQVSDIILLVFCMIFILSFVVDVIFEKYTTYSKKYKNLEIAEKVSKIASKNKIIVILDNVGIIFFQLIMLEFLGVFAFASCIALFTNINPDTFEWKTEMIEIIGNINIVALIIAMLSMLISSIYYIFVYIKIIKANK